MAHSLTNTERKEALRQAEAGAPVTAAEMADQVFEAVKKYVDKRLGEKDNPSIMRQLSRHASHLAELEAKVKELIRKVGRGY